MNYEQHKRKWSNCNLCNLCETRRSVVLLRGSGKYLKLPSPILFMGEAPGESEDVLGKPFVGPAGKLLDKIIAASGIEEGHYAITNIISCIPRENGKKIGVPPKESVMACKERLNECVEMVNPFVIVWVGQEAAKWGPKVISTIYTTDTVKITHPAAILRAPVAQQPLAVKKCVAVLEDIYEEVKRWMRNE